MSVCENFNLAKNPDGTCFSIYKGTTYNQLTFYYRDQDVSSYTPIGQIRNNYFDVPGDLIESFNFEPLIFGSVTDDTGTYNATIIQPTLTAAQTANIPATLAKEPSTPFLAGINGFVYDIKLIGSTETIIIARGFVQVFPDVSRL